MRSGPAPIAARSPAVPNIRLPGEAGAELVVGTVEQGLQLGAHVVVGLRRQPPLGDRPCLLGGLPAVTATAYAARRAASVRRG